MYFSIFATYLWLVLCKKTHFSHSENRNWFFFAMKRKTFFVNIVRAFKMHVCVEYGNIWTNYAMDVAITPVIWTESQKMHLQRDSRRLDKNEEKLWRVGLWMIWMSYLDFYHFSNRFTHIICRISTYRFVDMNYLIF